MKINVLQELKNFDGEVIQENFLDQGGEVQKKDFILRSVFTTAILANTPQSKNDSGGTKYKKYQLAGKVNASDEPDLSVEDLADLKKYVAECHGVLVVGRTWDLIDPKEDSDG